MNPLLSRLQPYPFERLRQLFATVTPSPDYPAISLGIGEPRHATPEFIKSALTAALDTGLASYPATAGEPTLREACAAWMQRRYGLELNPATQVLPVNGSREALFALAQTVIDPARADATVVHPNPFYQIYEGAALLAGAEPAFIDTTAATRFIPDLDAVPDSLWRRCQLLFLCSPGNPAGAVLTRRYLEHALELAERYDFVIAADECYADLYFDEANPPPSLLEAAVASGRSKFERCIVFHSLSKRSSVPGLRSGFVAGDPALVARFLLYRTYHGSAMPQPTQRASIAAWSEDAHATANRALYREKYRRVLPILAPLLDVTQPDGGFYLWPDVGADDEIFVRELFAQQNITLLPGSYLAREGGGGNPGRGRVRISLVAPIDECVEAAQRIRRFLESRT